MKKIFLDILIAGVGSTVEIIGDDYVHLARSLRVKVGDHFIIGDKTGAEYYCTVANIGRNAVSMLAESPFTRQKKERFRITLYFPLLKGDRTDLLLQKCTEIGVDVFIPLMTQNTVIQPGDKIETRYRRWQTIIREAAMQCGRRTLPEIGTMQRINELAPLKQPEEYGIVGTFGGFPLPDIVNNLSAVHRLFMVVGPEGDFTDWELQTLHDKFFTPVNLSDNILRSETACIFMSSIFSMHNNEVQW